MKKRRALLPLAIAALILAQIGGLAIENRALAQTFQSQDALLKAADDFFVKADYVQAKPLFSQLLSQDPMNPDYNYRYGACIMYTEADPTKPIPFIEGGASTPGVKPEAHYFLGKIYQFNYRFDDAVEAFEKFKKLGGKVIGREVDIEREIQTCVNGRVLYRADRIMKTEEKEAIAAEFYRPYDFRKLKGKVIPTPPNFKTKFDQKNLVGTFIFAPTTGDQIFYSSYGEDGLFGKDLYKAKKLPNGEWGLPVRLPNVINTTFDEDFAFFNEEKQILYFSSKGHNTMGGYDIFSSAYNAQTDSWSVPTNLQYPVNSPYDDFLYLTDLEETNAYFTTTRNSDQGRVRVIRARIADPALMDLTVIKGKYEDLTDAESNAMQATVIDPESNNVVGLYQSDKRSGNFLMVLPPKDDYQLTISPKGKADFKFDLDVPLYTEVDPLRQRAVFNANGDNGGVTLTNYFKGNNTKDSTVQRTTASGAAVAAVVQSKVEFSATELAQIKADAKINSQKDAEEKAKLEAARKQEEAAKKALAEAREKARQDSLAVVKREQERVAALLAAQEKMRQDSVARAELAAKARQQAVRDSIAKVREMEAARIKARQDSLARVEEARMKEEKRLAFERQKFLSDSLKSVQELKLARQRAIEDSLYQVRKQTELREKELADQRKREMEEKLAAQKKADEEAANAAAQAEAERKEQERLAQVRRKATEDSLDRIEAEKAAQQAELLAQKLKEEEEARLQAEAAKKQEEDNVAAAAREMEAEWAKEDAARIEAQRKATEDSLAQVWMAELAAKEVSQRQEAAARAKAEQEAQAAQAALEAQQAAEAQRIKQATEQAEAAARAKAEQEAQAAKAALEAQQAAEAQRIKQATEQAEAAARAKAEQEAQAAQAALEAQQAAEAQRIKQATEQAEAAARAKAEQEAQAAKAALEAQQAAEAQRIKQATEQAEAEARAKAEQEAQAAQAALEAQQAAEAQRIKQATEQAEAEARAKAEHDAAEAEAKRLEELKSSTFKVAESEAKVNEQATQNEGTTEKTPVTEADIFKFMIAKLENERQKLKTEGKLDEKARNSEDQKQPQPVDVGTPVTLKTDDPALAKSVEADRKALASQQEVAKKKEQELADRLQQDRDLMRGRTPDRPLSDDVVSTPSRNPSASDKAKVTDTSKPAEKVEDVKAANESEPEYLAKQAIAAERLRKEAEQAEAQAKAKQDAETKAAEDARLKEAAEADRLRKEAEQAEAQAMAKQDAEAKAAEDARLKEAAEAERLRKEAEQAEAQAKAKQDAETKAAEDARLKEAAEADRLRKEVEKAEADANAKTVAQPKVSLAEQAEKQPEVAATVATEEKPMVVAKKETKKFEPVLVKPSKLKTVVATPEARTNVLRPRPDFSHVKDPEVRTLIQLMYAEDQGRLSVMRSLRNRVIEAKGDMNKINQLRNNSRAMDVLAGSLPRAREEMQRKYDGTEHRRRNGVTYRLAFKFDMPEFSERLMAMMDAESAANLAPVHVEVETGSHETLRWAKRIRHEMDDRGLNVPTIVTLLNGVPTNASAVLDQPFIDK